jgi:hypothetical protein
MNPHATLILHETLCAVIFLSVFFRGVKSSGKVRADVRLAFFLLGAVACIGMAAPLVWGLILEPFWLFLLGAVAAVEIVTSRHWFASVPDQFYRPEHAPRTRRSTDYKGVNRRVHQ